MSEEIIVSSGLSIFHFSQLSLLATSLIHLSTRQFQKREQLKKKKLEVVNGIFCT